MPILLGGRDPAPGPSPSELGAEPEEVGTVSGSSAGAYRVHPEGVSAVLTSVRSEAALFETSVTPLPGAVAEAGAAADGAGASPLAAGLPTAGLIGAALATLLEVVGGDLILIETRVPAATVGLHDATRAVLDGDAAMATAVQALMVQAVAPVAALGPGME